MFANNDKKEINDVISRAAGLRPDLTHPNKLPYIMPGSAKTSQFISSPRDLKFHFAYFLIIVRMGTLLAAVLIA